MVIKKSKTPDGITLVLLDFSSDSYISYSVMSYPLATRTDDTSRFGAKRGERFCLNIHFNTFANAKKLLDFEDFFWNSKDVEFLLEENIGIKYIKIPENKSLNEPELEPDRE